MAFLCPVRVRRDNKKATNVNIERDVPILGLNHGLGRITGSASIETLVRVGIEKEHGLSPDSKMMVLHDFTPCVDDELEVKRGQFVNILYRENDWVYVIGQDTRQEGFIPYSYCAPFNGHVADMVIKKKLPRERIDFNESKGDLGHISISAASESINITSTQELIQETLPNKNESRTSSYEPECTAFHKEQSGRQIVLYTFIARDENDLSVERGEYVTLLNCDDPHWFWIMRNDGQEGFIPSSFVCPAENILQTHFLRANNTEHLHKSMKSDLVKTTFTAKLNILNSLATTNSVGQDEQQQISFAADDLQFHGTELVLLYDYKAQAPDDLSVRRGDWIYADLTNQTVDGWLWSYAPKTRKYGFIPKAYARPPAMTSL